MNSTTVVVGASRGLGHGIALAFAETGSAVIAVSRTAADYPEGVTAEIADGADPTVPARLLDRYDPQTVIIVAGATADIAFVAASSTPRCARSTYAATRSSFDGNNRYSVVGATPASAATLSIPVARIPLE